MNNDSPEISLVIPCYNEEGNLRELIKAIRTSVDPLNISYEVVITDDCSKDKSWQILKELAAEDKRIRVQKFEFNCGESAASFAGLRASRGKYLFTMDADLQNDPKDLPKFLEQLKHFDCVCGTRVKVRGEGTISSGWRHRVSRMPCATISPAKRYPMPAAPTALSSASASRT